MARPLTPAQVRARRKAIGTQLRALRKHSVETQKATAERAGLSLPPVVEMEGGTTSYRVDSLIQLCHAHGIDLAKAIGSASALSS